MRRIWRALGRTKWYWWVGGVLALVIVWLVFLRAQGYVWAEWMGFNGKTVWDVMELLIIPVTLAGVAAYLDKLERKTDREISNSNQREMALQNYFNFMTDLILKENLRKSDPGDEIREIARAKTLTTLQGLDKDRKKKLIEFLIELKLIKGEVILPIISLSTADLKGIDLDWAQLGEADLEGADLEGAQLVWAHLEGAHLEEAHLEEAHLEWAHLERAHLKGAYLKEVHLQWAHLEGADLEGAHLEESRLDGACLEGAHLEFAGLKRAILRNANLRGADLRSSDLREVDLLVADLIGANLEYVIFDGAIMPDGKKYDPGVHTVEMLTGGDHE